MFCCVPVTVVPWSTVLYAGLLDVLCPVWLYRLWPNPAVHWLCCALCMYYEYMCVYAGSLLLCLLPCAVWCGAHSGSFTPLICSHHSWPPLCSQLMSHLYHLPTAHHSGRTLIYFLVILLSFMFLFVFLLAGRVIKMKPRLCLVRFELVELDIIIIIWAVLQTRES